MGLFRRSSILWQLKRTMKLTIHDLSSDILAHRILSRTDHALPMTFLATRYLRDAFGPAVGHLAAESQVSRKETESSSK